VRGRERLQKGVPKVASGIDIRIKAKGTDLTLIKPPTVPIGWGLGSTLTILLRSICFILPNYLNPHPLGLIFHQLDKSQKWNLDKILIVPLSQITALLPLGIITHYNGTNLPCLTVSDQRPRGLMQDIG
jgi:hypothetical protein